MNVALIEYIVFSVSDTGTKVSEKLTWREAEDFLVGACQCRCQGGRQADPQLIRKRTIEHGLLSWGTMWRLFMKGGG